MKTLLTPIADHSKPERSKTEAADLAARIVSQMRDLGFRHKLGRSSRIRLGSLESHQFDLQASEQSSDAQAAERAGPFARGPNGEQPQVALQDTDSSTPNLPTTGLPTELSTELSTELLGESSLDPKIRNTYSLNKLLLNTGTDTKLLQAAPVGSVSTLQSRGSVRQPLAAGYIDTGCPGLGRLLPGGGYERGSLVEWFSQRHGLGVSSLSLLAAVPAMKDGKALVVIDWQGTFYPPSAAALGIDLQRVVVVRPLSREDGWWGLDQALRCPAIGAVWSELPEEMDDRLARRLQLAAEEGGTLGLFVRDIRTRGRPSWADVQWLVRSEPFAPIRKLTRNLTPSPTTPTQQHPPDNPSSITAGRCMQIELLRCRSGAGHGGSTSQRHIRLELGHKPHSLSSNQDVWVRELPPFNHEGGAKTTTESAAVNTTEIKNRNRVNSDRASGPLSSNLLRDSCDNNTLPNGLNRNDSHGDKFHDTHSKYLAAQLAMPACTRQPAKATSTRALGA